MRPSGFHISDPAQGSNQLYEKILRVHVHAVHVMWLIVSDKVCI